MSNRRVVERYARALADQDVDAQMALLHDDYVGRYPQSGETIRGAANARAIAENYPGGSGKGPPVSVADIAGTEEQWLPAASPMAWGVVHVGGANDEFSISGTIRYPNGEVWHAVALLTVRDGKIWRETDYFGPPFDAPDWRSSFVELDR